MLFFIPFVLQVRPPLPDSVYLGAERKYWEAAYGEPPPARPAADGRPALPLVNRWDGEHSIDVVFGRADVYLRASDARLNGIDRQDLEHRTTQALPESALWQSVVTFEGRLGNRKAIGQFYTDRIGAGDRWVREFRYTPLYDGVRLCQPAMTRALVDEGTGIVSEYDPNYTVLHPPADLAPRISMQQAKLNAAAYVFGHTRSTSIDYYWRSHLEIWIPDTVAYASPDAPQQRSNLHDSGWEQYLTPAQWAGFDKNTGILAYWIQCEGSGDDGSGRPPAWDFVHVDAIKGDILEYRHLDVGGFGGGAAKGKPAPFAWDVGPAPMTVSPGAKPVVGAVARCSAPKTPATDWRPAILTFASASIKAQFSPSLGLLRTGGPSQRSYGKPSPALCRALRRGAISASPSRSGGRP